jgi:hypothetical protein
MLIELPNGRWIDPAEVTGVNPMERDEFGPRVRIDLRNGSLALIEFDLPGAALSWAREFAQSVNAVLTEHT